MSSPSAGKRKAKQGEESEFKTIETEEGCKQQHKFTFFADLRRLHFKLDSLQKGRSKVGLIYVLIRLLSGRMPLTFNSVKNLCLASGYSLSLFVGTPINVYIIYRLSSKDVKKSNYFRLLILMCLIDVYQAVFGELDFWGEIIVIHSVP